MDKEVQSRRPLEERWSGKASLRQVHGKNYRRHNATATFRATLTMLLLSSEKVALTNMGLKAKPRLFSVSLTQNFQRGRQV